MDTASADDLYAGLPVPSSKPRGDAKRKAPAAERGSDEKGDADCSGGAPPPPEKRAKVAQKELSLEDALTRLRAHIVRCARTLLTRICNRLALYLCV
ncbi:hypothetical protein ATCC90586_011086 [Pythium insidiosum]|nr:hypothetical protein ATCC90586_011086 [Pythium insidiosum]